MRRSAEENGAPVGVFGLEQNVILRLGEPEMDIELATALGLTDMDPAGNSIGGAAETSRVKVVMSASRHTDQNGPLDTRRVCNSTAGHNATM